MTTRGRPISPPPHGPTVEQIFRAVSDVWRIDLSTLRRKQQGSNKSPAHARQLAAYLCRHYGWRCADIVTFGGWRDHCGVSVASNAARRMIPYDPHLREMHRRTIELIRARHPEAREVTA